jgi:tetratricopeptide (TPR) repeat protein
MRPDLDPAWRSELRRGLERLHAGDFAGAEQHFERAHGRAPGRPEVCVALGRERLRRGRIEEAETLLRGAWTADPSLVSAAASLARCLGIFAHRGSEALAILDDAQARHGADPGLLVVRSEVLLEERRVPEARDAAQAALAAASRGGERAARPSAAFAAAELALARVHNAEGLELARAGRDDEALFAFKRAIDLDGDWAAPVVNLGAAFARLGRGARARSAWERALVIDPENAAARRNLADDRVHTAVALEGEQDLDGAARQLAAALAVDPAHALAHARLALLYARQGRYLEAAEHQRRAHQLRDRDDATPTR